MLGFFGIYSSDAAHRLGTEKDDTQKRSIFRAWLPHEIAALNARQDYSQRFSPSRAAGKLVPKWRRRVDASGRADQKA